MGLSTFPSPAEVVLLVLVMNTVMSVALLKNMVRSVLQVVGGIGIGIGSSSSPNLDQEEQSTMSETVISGRRPRRVFITRFGTLCEKRSRLSRSYTSSSNCGCNGTTNNNGSPGSNSTECCCSVCLCRFEADEEVSELSCQHFFHKGCLDKWFDNQRGTCPLCRSIF